MSKAKIGVLSLFVAGPNRSVREPESRLPDLLDLVAVEGATPDVLATVPLPSEYNDHPILRPRHGGHERVGGRLEDVALFYRFVFKFLFVHDAQL